MDRVELHLFMNRHRYGVVSSVNAHGRPESALVGIAVTPELEIIFDTLNNTRKYANLTANPACSFVIGWQDEQTVQYEGHAFIPQGAELDRFRQIYFATWPDGPSRLRWAGLVHFVVRPHWLRWSDYGVSPPGIEETLIQTLEA
jgi:pyridoxine/pyridoxamine 5'-phosphate oxidase